MAEAPREEIAEDVNYLRRLMALATSTCCSASCLARFDKACISASKRWLVASNSSISWLMRSFSAGAWSVSFRSGPTVRIYETLN